MPRRQPASNNWNRWVVEFAAIGVLASIIPAGTAADPRPAALLAIHSQASGDPEAVPGLRVILDDLAKNWRLIDPGTLSFVAWPDPDCTSDGPEAEALIREVREGLRRYYDYTDLSGASSAFARAMDRLVRSPCILAHRDEERAVVVTAGLLWVRILRQGAAPAAARPAAEQLCGRFSPAEVGRADVPPDAKAFVESVRDELAGTRVAIRVRFHGAPDADGTRLLIDGIEVAPPDRDGFSVIPGRHAVSVVLPDGRVLTSRLDVGPEGGDIAIDLEVSAALSRVELPEPAVGVTSEGVLRRLASRSGATVLFLRETADGSLRVAATSPGSEDGLAATPTALLAATVQPTQRPWAWPWVTGALSAGFLSAGIALNALANQDADAINTGTNRLGDYGARRAGAIACYSLAAASVTATVLLGVLRPEARKLPSVAPVEGGAVVGLSGSF